MRLRISFYLSTWIPTLTPVVISTLHYSFLPSCLSIHRPTLFRLPNLHLERSSPIQSCNVDAQIACVPAAVHQYNSNLSVPISVSRKSFITSRSDLSSSRYKTSIQKVLQNPPSLFISMSDISQIESNSKGSLMMEEMSTSVSLNHKGGKDSISTQNGCHFLRLPPELLLMIA